MSFDSSHPLVDDRPHPGPLPQGEGELASASLWIRLLHAAQVIVAQQKLVEVCPHPSPLPQGEGEIVSASLWIRSLQQVVRSSLGKARTASCCISCLRFSLSPRERAGVRAGRRGEVVPASLQIRSLQLVVRSSLGKARTASCCISCLRFSLSPRERAGVRAACEGEKVAKKRQNLLFLVTA